MNNGLTLTANYTWSRSMDDKMKSSWGSGRIHTSKFDYYASAGRLTNNFKLTESLGFPTPHSHGPLVARLAGGWDIKYPHYVAKRTAVYPIL